MIAVLAAAGRPLLAAPLAMTTGTQGVLLGAVVLLAAAVLTDRLTRTPGPRVRDLNIVNLDKQPQRGEGSPLVTLALAFLVLLLLAAVLGIKFT